MKLATFAPFSCPARSRSAPVRSPQRTTAVRPSRLATRCPIACCCCRRGRRLGLLLRRPRVGRRRLRLRAATAATVDRARAEMAAATHLAEQEARRAAEAARGLARRAEASEAEAVQADAEAYKL